MLEYSKFEHLIELMLWFQSLPSSYLEVVESTAVWITTMDGVSTSQSNNLSNLIRDWRGIDRDPMKRISWNSSILFAYWILLSNDILKFETAFLISYA